ncbi:MAG: DinB family protein [Saprospiraceae bacterium]
MTNQGAKIAILDEYKKAIDELKEITKKIPIDYLLKTLDTETKDEDCQSIQSILTHVVASGYTYVIEIRKWLGEDISYYEKTKLESVEQYHVALDEMFAYNEKLFQDYPSLRLETYDPENKIKVRWGQSYDVEQLFEHAIVHILRHRRQIERFLNN